MTTLYAINIPMMMRERQTAPRRPTKINFLLFAPSVIVDIDDTEKYEHSFKSIFITWYILFIISMKEHIFKICF